MYKIDNIWPGYITKFYNYTGLIQKGELWTLMKRIEG